MGKPCRRLAVERREAEQNPRIMAGQPEKELFMLVVNEDKCIGCGQCVPFCPNEALEAWGIAKVKREDCTDCFICVDYCPVDALEILEESSG